MKGYHTSLAFRTDPQPSSRSAVRKLVTEENHEVGDYGLLNRAVSRQMQRKKKKKRQNFTTISDCLSHCQSLDKLQQLNAEKNEEIKRHIYEKAEYQAHNEELKQLINNPTLREHQLHLKIAELEQQNRLLKEQLENQQKRHRQELQTLKNHHKTQLQLYQQTQRITNEYTQKRVQPYEGKTDNYRSAETTKVEIGTIKAGNQRIYQQTEQNVQTITNKQQGSQRMQVFAQQSKNYIAGTPVYISARSEEAKLPMARTLSPDSKNTTSHTQIYRADSPKIITHPYHSTQAVNHIQINSVNSNPKQEVKYELPKTGDRNIYSKPQSGSVAATGEVRSVGRVSYGEQDLQQIYRKYCIND